MKKDHYARPRPRPEDNITTKYYKKSRGFSTTFSFLFNPFKPSGAKWLHYKVFKAIDVRALWRLVLSARVPERQKNKNGGLDQYGFEHFVV